LELKDLRGNVPTRIEKIQAGHYDAIVLAAAGLRRLEIEADGLIEVLLGSPLYIPAPAQGILAYQIRQQDAEMHQICKLLHHPEAFETVALEREILHDFHGGCQIPLGVFVHKSDDNFHLWIAKGEQWNAPVARFYHRWKASESLSAAYFVEKFNQINACKVFISRDLSNNDIFYRSLTNLHFEVNGKSLVNIQAANFEMPTSADFIFFTSKNGVKYFFQHFQPNGKLPAFAAINSATAMAIVQAGYEVAFIGQHNDTPQTIEDFSTIAHGEIFFAQAEQPIADHAQILRNKGFNAQALTVYHNSPLTEISPIDAEILVFTSPMNVRAYFAQQPLQPHQKVVSIGPSTTAALAEQGIFSLESFDPMPWSLVDRVIWSSIPSDK
jgi:uroporphyrinogen-III synthase